MEQDTLIAFGDSIKMLENGKFGGYLVRFGDPTATDLSKEYFTKNTDFDVDFSDGPVKSTIYYNHGLDKNLKRRKLGKAEMKMDDVGIWVECQLEERDEYEQAIAKMAREGKLGWSSGTASHLTERKSVGEASEITMWPLGLDASMTPTPCEYRNEVVSIKKYVEDQTEVKHFSEDIEKYMTVAALSCLNDQLWYNVIWSTVYDEDLTAAQKAKKCADAIKQYSVILQKVIAAMLTDASEETMKSMADEIREHFIDPELTSVSGTRADVQLKKHLSLTLSSLAEAVRRAEDVKTKRLADEKDSVSAENRETLEGLKTKIEELLVNPIKAEAYDWATANEIRRKSLETMNRIKETYNV